MRVVVSTSALWSAPLVPWMPIGARSPRGGLGQGLLPGQEWGPRPKLASLHADRASASGVQASSALPAKSSAFSAGGPAGVPFASPKGIGRTTLPKRTQSTAPCERANGR